MGVGSWELGVRRQEVRRGKKYKVLRAKYKVCRPKDETREVQKGGGVAGLDELEKKYKIEKKCLTYRGRGVYGLG